MSSLTKSPALLSWEKHHHFHIPHHQCNKAMFNKPLTFLHPKSLQAWGEAIIILLCKKSSFLLEWGGGFANPISLIKQFFFQSLLNIDQLCKLLTCLTVLSKHKENVSQSPQLMQFVVIYNLTMLKGKYILKTYCKQWKTGNVIIYSSLVIGSSSSIFGAR